VLGSGEAVTIAFGGDTNFEGAAAERLAADPASVLAPVAALLGAADLAVVNMETAIGTGGTPAPKEFVFQAPPEALEAFRAAGVDVVSAANNHGMDFGVDSLHETLAAEQAVGLPVIGIGADETEAYAPFVAEVRGQRIAVIAATQVLDGDLIDAWTATPDQPGLASAKRVDRLVQAVAEARAVADTVVVFLHWGVERETCPTATQQDLADALVAAGADVIVGGHAHRVQGGGRLGGAVVHYGLGNFGFHAASPEAAATGVFVVTVTGRRVDGYEWVPGRVVDHQPVLLDGERRDAALAAWHDLRRCTNLVA
jgi:poly-gamma-glutamate synthesis protein (capsule biosynthesis protein)